MAAFALTHLTATVPPTSSGFPSPEAIGPLWPCEAVSVRFGSQAVTYRIAPRAEAGPPSLGLQKFGIEPLRCSKVGVPTTGGNLSGVSSTEVRAAQHKVPELHMRGHAEVHIRAQTLAALYHLGYRGIEIPSPSESTECHCSGTISVSRQSGFSPSEWPFVARTRNVAP